MPRKSTTITAHNILWAVEAVQLPRTLLLLMTQMHCRAVFSRQARVKTEKGRRSVSPVGEEDGSKGLHDYNCRGC